jgi:hypothetical protein
MTTVYPLPHLVGVSSFSSRSADKAGREVRYPLPVGRGKGEGPLREALSFKRRATKFYAWRPKLAPGAEVPHLALRAGLSRRGEVIHTPTRKSTVFSCERGSVSHPLPYTVAGESSNHPLPHSVAGEGRVRVLIHFKQHHLSPIPPTATDAARLRQPLV